MRFHVLLAPPSARTLQRAVGPDHEVVIDTSETAVDLITKAHGACIVIDPAALDEEVFDAVVHALAQRKAGFVIYGTLDAETAARIVTLARLGPHAVLLRDDHAPELLRAQLASVLKATVPARVLANVASHFETFPSSLQATSVALFSVGPMPRWVGGLVDGSGLARRTVDRWMVRGGITGAATLLDTARMARVWEPLVVQQRDPKLVAVEHGYRRIRLLSIHLDRLVGTTLTELGTKVDEDKFVSRLTATLTGR